MAAFALALLVSAEEFEISTRVIEPFLVDGRNVGGTSFVFRMAVSTVIVVKPAVQAALGAHVGGNFLVAIDAQFCLCLLVKTLMTLLALVLVFGVPRDDFARHQHLFDRLRRGPAGKGDDCDERQTGKKSANTCGPQQHGRLH